MLDVRDLLFVAGGVGINPLFSMLQHRAWLQDHYQKGPGEEGEEGGVASLPLPRGEPGGGPGVGEGLGVGVVGCAGNDVPQLLRRRKVGLLFSAQSSNELIFKVSGVSVHVE